MFAGMTKGITFGEPNRRNMNINQKINAKGNREIFNPNRKQSGITLITLNYKMPYQDVNLPSRLLLNSEFGSNYKGH